MFCWHCGERLDWTDVLCETCGADPYDEGENYDDDEYPFDEEDNY